MWGSLLKHHLGDFYSTLSLSCKYTHAGHKHGPILALTPCVPTGSPSRPSGHTEREGERVPVHVTHTPPPPTWEPVAYVQTEILNAARPTSIRISLQCRALFFSARLWSQVPTLCQRRTQWNRERRGSGWRCPRLRDNFEDLSQESQHLCVHTHTPPPTPQHTHTDAFLLLSWPQGTSLLSSSGEKPGRRSFPPAQKDGMGSEHTAQNGEEEAETETERARARDAPSPKKRLSEGVEPVSRPAEAPASRLPRLARLPVRDLLPES